MKLTTILSDLDGTLYPISSPITKEFDERITAYVARTTGLAHEQALKVRQHYFRTYGTTLRGLQTDYPVDIEDYLAYTHNLTYERYLERDHIIDQLLASIPLRKAIFTNSPIEHARPVLETLGIVQHFERIFDLRFLDFVPKPAVEGYRRVLDALGVTGQQVVMIEDTYQNLVTAHDLGMTTILVRETPADAPLPAAEHTVPDVLAALSIIRDLAAGAA